jgi:hypothetical protein
MKGTRQMATETVAYRRAEVMSADERWAAWVAKGAEHDRKIKERAIAIATAVAAGAFLSLIVFIVYRLG